MNIIYGYPYPENSWSIWSNR